MRHKKGSLSFGQIIGVILALLFLVVSFSVAKEVISGSEYERSIFECQFVFNNIDGSATYFGKSLNSPNLNFFKVIGVTCPSKDFDVSQNSVSGAAQLAADCWAKTGKGVDIMPNTVNDLGVCLYCGRINSDDEIVNFDDLFIEEIVKKKYDVFNDSEILNTNGLLLYDKDYLPDNLLNGESLGVFYYIYKPGVGKCSGNDFEFSVNGCTRDFSNFVGSYVSVGSKLLSVFVDGGNSVGGVFFVKMNNDEAAKFDGFLEESIDINTSEETITKLKNKLDNTIKEKNFECDVVVVPKKNFD